MASDWATWPFSDAFKSTTEGRGQRRIKLSESQKKADKFLSSLLDIDAPLEEIEGLSAEEKSALGMVRTILSEGMPQLREATALARRTAGTDVSVETMPELRGLIDQIREEGRLEAGRLGRSLQIKGAATTSRGRDILGRSLTGTQQRLVASALPYLEAAKARQFQAIPLLAQLATTERVLPIELGFQYGALPRQIGQAKKTAAFRQKMFPFTAQAPVAESIMGQQRFAFDPGTTTPSIFSQLAGPAAMLGGSLLRYS